MESLEIKVRAWHELNKQMVYPKPGGLSSGDILNRFSPEFIMLSTGLTDKNDKEIHAGDIVKHDDRLMVVGWSERFASFVIQREDWLFSHWFGESCEPSQCEVVGNIHETPELITAPNLERSVATDDSSEKITPTA